LLLILDCRPIGFLFKIVRLDTFSYNENKKPSFGKLEEGVVIKLLPQFGIATGLKFAYTVNTPHVSVKKVTNQIL